MHVLSESLYNCTSIPFDDDDGSLLQSGNRYPNPYVLASAHSAPQVSSLMFLHASWEGSNRSPMLPLAGLSQRGNRYWHRNGTATALHLGEITGTGWREGKTFNGVDSSKLLQRLSLQNHTNISHKERCILFQHSQIGGIHKYSITCVVFKCTRSPIQ